MSAGPRNAASERMKRHWAELQKARNIIRKTALMHSHQTLVELVGLAYEAAADPAQWMPFLEELGRALKAPWCALHVHDLAQGRCDAHVETGFDPAYRAPYEQHFASRNVFFIHGRQRLRPGLVTPGEALCPESVLLRSEFYNDWLAPQGMGCGLNATIALTESVASVADFIRPAGTQPFNHDDVSLLQALMPHLQRAVRLHETLTDLRSLEAGAREALNRWSMGLFLVDRDARVVVMNRAGEELVRAGTSLLLHRGVLRAFRPDENARLKRLIHDAATSRDDPTTSPGGVMAVANSDSSRPLHLLVTPLVQEHRFGARSPAACAVFVTNPSVLAETDRQLLEQHYGLTPTEAKVALLLVQGHDVRYISDYLRVSLNTTRTHVQRVLRKTDTRRQTELVVRLLTDPTSTRLRK